MAKSTGLAWTTLSIDDSAGAPVVIKNDVTDLSIGTPRGVQDVTGVDKSAIERLLLLADMTVDLNGVFNATVSHTALRTVPSSAVLRTTTLTVGGVTLAGELFYTDYKLKRSTSGELTWSSPGVLGDGAVPTWA